MFNTMISEQDLKFEHNLKIFGKETQKQKGDKQVYFVRDIEAIYS